jgi:hypothetical protein
MTVAAAVYPTENPVVGDGPARRPSLAGSATAVALVPTSAVEPEWVAADENPFAPRNWVTAPASVEQPRPVLPVVTPEVAAVPLPQSLPFKFVGQMTDGGNHVVYLSLNEQLVVAHNGDLLEGGYKVLEITPTQIEFEFNSTGTRQALPIPAQDN